MYLPGTYMCKPVFSPQISGGAKSILLLILLIHWFKDFIVRDCFQVIDKTDKYIIDRDTLWHKYMIINK